MAMKPKKNQIRQNLCISLLAIVSNERDREMDSVLFPSQCVFHYLEHIQNSTNILLSSTSAADTMLYHKL